VIRRSILPERGVVADKKDEDSSALLGTATPAEASAGR
jgi:hypothetical protein